MILSDEQFKLLSDRDAEIARLKEDLKVETAISGVRYREMVRLESRVKALEHAADALLDRQDFWKNAGVLPGEYDNLMDVVWGKP
jgi:hypothetical protein